MTYLTVMFVLLVIAWAVLLVWALSGSGDDLP